MKENLIRVVSHDGKNYFSIKSDRGMEFLVIFLRMRYFAGKDKIEFYRIEGWRNGCAVLNGYVSCYSRDAFTATFDYSDISPVHTEPHMREFEVLSAEPFKADDTLSFDIPGGILIG